MACFVLAVFAVAVLGVWMGVWGTEWRAIAGTGWQAPSWAHPLGTNRLGQDIFDRLLVSLSQAFTFGLPLAIGCTLLGGAVGLLAGWTEGRLPDRVLLGLVGIIEAMPVYVILGLLVLAWRDWSAGLAMAVMLVLWTPTARLMRVRAIELRQARFIEAARVAGAGRWRILIEHVLPHSAPLLLVQGSLIFITAIKAEVLLSFLGISLGDSMSFGFMLAEAADDVLAGQFWNFAAASLGLLALISSVQYWADRLQARMDPRRLGSALSLRVAPL
ncbi:ABC transporter permease [Wenzhouxiangella marina]|uniref:ABC transporter permease n=1 Tax=Wenzhouxiangella marina TaxID=1579979 RepID=UPI00067315F7|nr:ABC transporter permease subunit [Wenzhouxiangella marina]MBB6087219.1 ABC-type dipeptide/oligopeptide/nickel transport system permease subunit [Wenzhouxiangella marina]